jgi:hypothetical protein
MDLPYFYNGNISKNSLIILLLLLSIAGIVNLLIPGGFFLLDHLKPNSGLNLLGSNGKYSPYFPYGIFFSNTL